MQAGIHFTERRFRSWQKIKRFITEEMKDNWIFRGHSDKTWRLQTSIERVQSSLPLSQAEPTMMRGFSSKASLINPNLPYMSTLDWIIMMQHYGVPTRLLDFTASAYVALYFALEDGTGDAALWAINRDWCHDRGNKMLSKNSAHPGGTYLESVSRLHHIFTQLFLENKSTCVYPVEPFRFFDRAAVQQGILLCPGNVDEPFEKNLEAMHDFDMKDMVIKIIIPRNLRNDALLDLNSMNINRFSLFPGLDGLGGYLKRWIKIIPPWDPGIFQAGSNSNRAQDINDLVP